MFGWLVDREDAERDGGVSTHGRCLSLVWSLALQKPGGPGETGFGEEGEEGRVQGAVR